MTCILQHSFVTISKTTGTFHLCGLTGFIDYTRNLSEDSLKNQGHAMTQAIYHRGPDDGDIWVNTENNLVLGHRRLSILDLSAAGHQPMHSANGLFTLVFNGEIYNYLSLKEEINNLTSIKWRGHSDTEVILEAFAILGFEETLNRMNGMFALALYDHRAKKLFMARDRFGEKPLYFGQINQTFLFGSELKSLKINPQFKKEINSSAVRQLLRLSYIPSPLTIYENIYKMKPGHYICVDVRNPAPIQQIAYWDVDTEISKSKNSLSSLSYQEATDELEKKLSRIISSRMISDVPLGALLSGGIDSSTIVALMQNQSKTPIRTFAIGFDEQEFNEAPHAKNVANFLKTDHTELYVTADQVIDIIPKMTDIYDEPFADSSQLPTFLVCQMARKHVTVCLSGDAGDELFGGYSRYHQALEMQRKLTRLPKAARWFLQRVMLNIPSQHLNKIFYLLTKHRNAGDKLHRLANSMAQQKPKDMYENFIGLWSNEINIMQTAQPYHIEKDAFRDDLGFAENMMRFDTTYYLADDILTKVDRASMAVGLECRVPFLDPELFSFIWSLPLEYRIKDANGKKILRSVLNKYVPSELTDRPKMGFGVPVGSWLRGPLKDWAMDLLDPVKIKQEGFLNPTIVQAKWDQHLNGDLNWQYHLWPLLMFQAWLRNN